MPDPAMVDDVILQAVQVVHVAFSSPRAVLHSISATFYPVGLLLSLLVVFFLQLLQLVLKPTTSFFDFVKTDQGLSLFLIPPPSCTVLST